MKILVLKFPEGTDLAKFPAGTKDVKVTVGTDEVAGGTVLLSGPLYEEPILPPELPVHKHPVVAAAQVIGETGPSEPV